MALLSTITSEMHPNQQAQQARIRPRRRSRGESVSANVMAGAYRLSSLKPVPTNCATSRPVSSETSTFTTHELRPSLR